MPIQLDSEGREPRALVDVGRVRNARVLEIGCGDGRLVFRYAKLATSVVGIDPSAETVTTAVRTCPRSLRGRAAFTRADAVELPFRNAVFDVALFGWSL